jgi:tetratricopeptide (TPR) repeat protein
MAEIISAILMSEPHPLAQYSIVSPAGLEQILRKCLEKDRERRYQTMREVATDLETMRRECESGDLVFPTIDRAAATIRMGGTNRTANRHALPTSRPGMALAAVVMLTAVASVYALFFRSPHTVPSSSAKSVNSAAYDFYLRGKINVSSENRENNESAIKLLEQAIAADPNFASAYAELARAYNIKAFYYASDAEKKKLNVEAEVAVEKALTLNPDLPEGHFARGLILWTHANRFPHDQAIQSYKRALALDPNLDEAHHQLGVIYFHIGLLDKAQEEIEQALAINPSNTFARFRLGVINLYRARYEEALAVFKSTPLDKNPSLWSFQTACALLQLGRTQEASQVVEEYLKTNATDEGGTVTSVKVMLLAKAGKEREAEEMIRRAVEIGKGFGHFHHTAYNIASAYALLNKPEQAVKWLQVAADDGFPCYPLFENDANLNSLRKDKRFIAFIAKMRQQWERNTATL